MAIIDITSDLYSDVTYTRPVTARQLLELPRAELVALRVVDREDPEHMIWVRIDGIDKCSIANGRINHVVVDYNDGWHTTQYFNPNKRLEIAMVG